MQLEALKVFCDIARVRSFSKAAEVNDLSQSAVSRIVHELEQRLGAQLIDRSRRPLQLTTLGQTYFEGCQALLEHYLELEATIRAAGRAPLALTLPVAAIYSVGLGDIHQHVASFEAAHPHVKVQIEYLHPELVYERVLAGTAELGLVSYPRGGKKLEVEPWREEPMMLACRPDHPLAALDRVRPDQLTGHKFVAFDRGLTIRREIDRFFRRHGISVEVALEFDNIEHIKKGIEIGAGVGLLPEPTLRQEAQTGELRVLPFDGCELVRPLGIIHRRHHRLGAAAVGFLQLLLATGGTGRPDAGPALPRRTRTGAAAVSAPPTDGAAGSAAGAGPVPAACSPERETEAGGARTADGRPSPLCSPRP